MTTDIDALQRRLTDSFPDIERIEPTVLRFTRRAGKTPYATCFVETDPELPADRQTLDSYQDRLIGKRYFDGAKSLQWNTYLYFVVPAQRLTAKEIAPSRLLIEADRTYARKFVVSEESLEEHLRPFQAEEGTPSAHGGVLAGWSALLAKVGLLKIVLGDAMMPGRLDAIEALEPPSSPAVPPAGPTTRTVQAAPFLRSMRFTSFRALPRQRDFDFGRVNLVAGPNGTGKTSLLEGIELLYCGKNKRNPGARPRYALDAKYADGSTESATHDRPLRVFRDRHLQWYGQSEVKANTLYASFGRFNFLDTDAAVGLAESSDAIESDLATLLVGPQAGKAWQNIQKTHDAVAERLRQLGPRVLQNASELATLRTRQRPTTADTTDSTAVLERARHAASSAGWSIAADKSSTVIAAEAAQLAELVALLRQTAEIPGLPAPLTLGGLTDHCRNADTGLPAIAADVSMFSDLSTRAATHEQDRVRCEQAVAELRAIAPIVHANIQDRLAAYQRARDEEASLGALLAGCNPSTIDSLAARFGTLPIAACHAATTGALTEARKAVGRADTALQAFVRLRDASLSLGQTLRNVAHKLLDVSTERDECPLCHSRFGPGELESRMQAGVDPSLESTSQTLRDALGRCEEEHTLTLSQDQTAEWLERYARASRLPPNVTVAVVAAACSEQRRALTARTEEVARARAELDDLGKRGLSSTRLEAGLARLRELGCPLQGALAEGLPLLEKQLAATLASAESGVTRDAAQAKQLVQRLTTALSPARPDLASIRTSLSRREQAAAAARALLKQIAPLVERFPWAQDRPLAEIAVEAESLRSLLIETQAASSREAKRLQASAEDAQRMKQLDAEGRPLATKLEHLQAAERALSDIIRNHSLQAATETSRNENRGAIESIFRHIHAPAEFTSLGEALTTLVRAGGDIASLAEISTGQRAAFALSVFLAQNARTVTPPVVLIDDPIAHVDDLNALSFLDYLRDVAVAGRRQLFFATASEKLATLFERKFDFLGGEFCRFDLRRD